LIFAVHPLHVESVAWITERKDVLSACFLFLTLIAYLRYTFQPSIRRYLPVLMAFGLGLMTKPMLVTVPFLLLLLDGWPLQRWHWQRCVWEKLPLLLVSAAASIATYSFQKQMGAVQTIAIGTRISNALLSYVLYLRQTLWPARMAVFYPYPKAFASWTVWCSLGLLLAVSAGVIAVRRTRPWLAFGWFWYVGLLVPVAGFVQAGWQSRADRYMYLPLVGIAVMAAWSATELVERWPRTKPLVVVGAASCILFSTAIAWRQASYWQNEETLYQHALAVTADNWLAHGNLGASLLRIPERRGESMAHLEESLRIRPDNPEVESNIGLCLVDAGLCDSAIPHFEAALRRRPNNTLARLHLGLCILKDSRFEQAAAHFEKVLQLDAGKLAARLGLAQALANIPGREAEAISQYQTALRANPDSSEAHRGLADVLVRVSRTEEAIVHLEAAQRLRPEPEVAQHLAALRLRKK